VCADTRNGSATLPSPTAAPAQHEAPLGELLERILEGGEVPAGERLDRPPARALGAHPSPQHLGPRLGLALRLVDQRQQDLQLRAMIQLSGEQRQRVDSQRRAQLVLGQAEQLLQPGGARPLSDVAISRDRPIVAVAQSLVQSNG
jgi:hypothetical protein